MYAKKFLELELKNHSHNKTALWVIRAIRDGVTELQTITQETQFTLVNQFQLISSGSDPSNLLAYVNSAIVLIKSN